MNFLEPGSTKGEEIPTRDYHGRILVHGVENSL